MDFSRERVRFLFEDLETPQGKLVDLFIVFIILLAVANYVAGTYPLSPFGLRLVYFIEVVLGFFFMLEYGLRFWIARNRLSYVFSLYSLIDLAAIIPLFITVYNLQFLRVFRLFRIFKLTRFLEDSVFFFGEIKQSMLYGARILFTIIVIVFVASGLILTFESEVNREMSTFFDAMYFSVVTLTTVGYGDIVPVTDSGRFVAFLIIASGVVFIPWQLGGLLREVVSGAGKREVVCGGCGLSRHDPDAVHCKHCGKLIYQETRGG